MQATQPVYEDYRDSLVVFADILGMEREIRAIANEQSFRIVATVLGLLRGQAESWCSMDGTLQDFRATAVSDSLIIPMPWRSKGAAVALIEAMSDLQYGMLLNAGRLLRGYLTRGRLHHKGEAIFGEGYVRAYQGEQGLKSGPP